MGTDLDVFLSLLTEERGDYVSFLIHDFQPLSRSRDWADVQRQRGRSARHVDGTRPAPVLRAGYKTRSHWIAFDVPPDGQEVQQIGDPLRLEPTLVNRAFTPCCCRATPSARVCSGHPVEEPREFTLPFGPEQKMPVVRHQTVRNYPHRPLFSPVRQHSLKGGIFVRASKKRPFSRAPIAGVVHDASGCHSACSCHDGR